MASSQQWYQYNGSTCVQTAANSGLSYMAIDSTETGTLYTSNPIPAGSNSVIVYTGIAFSGSSAWNNLSNLYYYWSSAAPATGVTIKTGNAAATSYNVTPYVTPVTSSPPAIGSTAVQTTSTTASNFGGNSFTTGASNVTGPFVASGSQNAAVAYAASGTNGLIYGMACASQMITTSGAAAGTVSGTGSLTASWTES